MNRRMIGAAAALVLVVAGCGAAATPAPTLAPGATLAPGTTVAPGTTQAPGVTQAPGATLGPAPSFNGDPVLAARFPKQLGSTPVTDVSTALYLDYLKVLGASQSQVDDIKRKLASAGADPNTLVYGRGVSTVDGELVTIQAFRFPGKAANDVLKNFDIIQPLDSGEKRTDETVGGKKASVVRDENGYASEWYYAAGDTLWNVSTSSEDEAVAVFSALQ